MGKMIDIILVHPEKTEFASMLFRQRQIDFTKIRVIEMWNIALTSSNEIYPCEHITEIRLAATEERLYNEGIRIADADWVMFCDGRDCFSSVYSLWALLHVMPNDKADILWMDGYREEMLSQKPGHINQTSENFAQVYGKLYRREFLLENRLYMDCNYGGMSGYAFNTVAIACTKPSRIMKIRSQISPYTNTFRETGIFSEHILTDMVQASMGAALDIVLKELDGDAQIVKAMYYAYIAQGTNPCVKVMDYQLKTFMIGARKIWERMHETEREVIFKEAFDDFLNAYQMLFNVYGKECVPPEPSCKAADRWIQNLQSDIITADKPKKKRCVAVYSGTRNVYHDIVTSIKSLLYHTKMDAVYVLAEDTKLGYDLPECVKVIDASEQMYFDKDGPNYDTPWSYMILMRAAYPMLFAQEDMVLSLDIDTIIQEDISDLFNTDLTGYYFAGVHEIQRDDNPKYCNFGVILMNLEKLRDGKSEDIIRALNKTRFDYPEQTAFNTMCGDDIKLLPNRYNATPYSRLTGETDRESIVHYAGIRYWKCFAPVRKYALMSWNEVMNHE